MNATDPMGLAGDCSDPSSLCYNGSGGGSGGPIDDSGNPYWSYGSEPSPTLSSSFTGGGALGGSYYVMSQSYSAPGALIHESDNAGTEFNTLEQIIGAPFIDIERSGAYFRDDRPGSGTWHAILAVGAFVPVGGEEEVALTTTEKIAAASNGVREGVYTFVSKSGIKYVGQSSNIPRRLAQWVRAGRLAIEDLDTVVTRAVTGGKTAREIEEQLTILREGGIGNLLNELNPIGPARANLLPQWAKTLLGYK